MTDNVNRLLVVDDEPGIVDLIAAIARRLDYAVASTGDPSEFLDLIEPFQPTLIVMDLDLPEIDGVELLRRLAAAECKTPVLLMSGVDDRVLTTAYEVGASRGLSMCGMLKKPVLVEELRSKLTAVMNSDRQLTLADLRRGIEAGEIVPYYQPKASLIDKRSWIMDGVEALARWQHPRLGIVMPDEFIPLAERSGLIRELTNSVLRQALRQVKQWNGEGLRLRCAVNLPPSLVTDLALPDRVAALLAEHALDGSQLALELTETATMQDPTTTMDILTRLRVKRVGLSLDDFGTGFSSLTRLYQMPFDEMKIDKSLVINVPRSREANTIVGSLIELGHNLGLTICAEGVENRAALDLLAIMGCDRCQGYFLSRAVPAPDVPSIVHHWNEDNPAATYTGLPRAI
jgi:EAL domain-containing protein (putative c-di-GMP-specific phosphodiesterase class I)/ActR/RegA family two-component response regulator